MAGNIRTGRPIKNMTRGHTALFKAFTAFGGDIDLTVGPDGLAAAGSMSSCEIHFIPSAAGTIVVQRVSLGGGVAPVNVSIPILLGVPYVFPGEAAKIVAAGTTFTGTALVFW